MKDCYKDTMDDDCMLCPFFKECYDEEKAQR